jgi:hypothetical protein
MKGKKHLKYRSAASQDEAAFAQRTLQLPTPDFSPIQADQA